ncbi:MAG: hypothetical protein Q4A97_08255 [Comamonadaceae bacterium]|nr:hypothetical protein [Comamonadaceae bacterium]
MRTTLLSTLIASAVALLCACGGGSDQGPGPGVNPGPGSQQPGRPDADLITAQPRVRLALLWGPLRPVSEAARVQQAGCVDGPSGTEGGPLLGHTQALAPAHASASAALLTLEQGACDRQWRLRRLDLGNGQMHTVYTAAQPDFSAAQPQSLLSPSAVLDLGQGRYLIADSEIFTGGLTITRRDKPGFGNGLWLLHANGQLQQLAGFATPNRSGAPGPFRDGQGPAASFSSLTALCASHEPQHFYALDAGVLRSIDLDGRVTTLRHGAEGRQLHGLVCGAAGQALAALRPEGDAPQQVAAVELPSGRQYSLPRADFSWLVALAGNGQAWRRDPDQPGKLQLYDLQRAQPIEGTAVHAQHPQLQGLAFAAGDGQTLYYAGRQALLRVQAD